MKYLMAFLGALFILGCDKDNPVDERYNIDMRGIDQIEYASSARDSDEEKYIVLRKLKNPMGKAHAEVGQETSEEICRTNTEVSEKTFNKAVALLDDKTYMWGRSVLDSDHYAKITLRGTSVGPFTFYLSGTDTNNYSLGTLLEVERFFENLMNNRQFTNKDCERKL